jgi:hypothetical protein
VQLSGLKLQEVALGVNVPLPNLNAVAMLLQVLNREDVKLLIKKNV